MSKRKGEKSRRGSPPRMSPFEDEEEREKVISRYVEVFSQEDPSFLEEIARGNYDPLEQDEEYPSFLEEVANYDPLEQDEEYGPPAPKKRILHNIGPHDDPVEARLSEEERWELMSIAASREIAKRSRKQDKENAIFGKKKKDR
jgi:hypothetical protein